MFLRPVRKIKPSNRSVTGKRSSSKTKVSQHFESALERDMLTLLEFDDAVMTYGVQPVPIQYWYNNKMHRYTPDVAVYYKPEFERKPLLVEVKYEAELQEKHEIYEPKFKAANEFAANHGYEFKVITEKEIRTDYLGNIKFISRYRHSTVDDSCASQLLTWFKNTTQVTPQQILTHEDHEINALMLHTLWQLVADKTLLCNMQQKICMTSAIWKNQSK